MTSMPIMSISIQQERDVANARNFARLSARTMAFSVTDQARIGWAVANLARKMLMLSSEGTMSIDHIQQDTSWGIRVTCHGDWLRMVRQSWVEKTTLDDLSQWLDEVQFVDGSPPHLMLILWPSEH